LGGHGVQEPEVKTLEELFRRTKAKPYLYWLPLTDEQLAAKKRRLSAEERKVSAGPSSRV
jgi:RNSP1-SAP18 binding (RSB) motif